VLLTGEFTSVFKDRIIPKNNDINFKKSSDSTSIIIVSDGDVIANEVSSSGNAFPLGYDRYINYTFDGNKKFIINAIQYLNDHNGLINLRSKSIKLRLLNNEKISNYRTLITMINLILPILIFLFLIFIINQKNKLKYD